MNNKKCLAIMAIAVASTLFLASSCTVSTNNPPIIVSLEPDGGRAVPLGSLQVVCNASDADGDELSYDWSASAGELSGDGDTITWTAPASEGSYSVTVAVTDGRGGEVTDYVIVTVRANNPPTIASLIAEPEWTLPSGTLQVTCNASDPDDDELTYEWTATSGDISGTGAAVSWTAPQEVGTYEVTVVVTDSFGSSATASLPIGIVTGQPPAIEALLVTAEHCYLKPIPPGYYVGMEQEYNIECIVADTGVELFYEWSCTDGVISGQGSLITWTAPNESVNVVVNVIVSDISGSMASENITLGVVPCSYCMFGC